VAETETQIIISAKDLTSSAFDSVNKALEAFRKNTENTAGGIDKMVGMAKGAGAAFGVMIASDVVGKLVEFHSRVQESTGALKDQAEGLNLTTDQLQAYVAAFARVGVGEEEARSLLNKFNQTIGEAALGNQGAIDSFKLLGVHILDSSGKVRDQTAILTEAAQKLSVMDEGTQRTAISMQLFGRSGGQLRSVLQELGISIDELTRRAKENGTVIDRETIDTFEQLNRSSQELSLQIRTLYAQIAAPIQMAVVTELTTLAHNLAENIKNAHLNWLDLVGAFANPGMAIARAFAPPEIDQLRASVTQLTKDIAEQQAIIDKGGGALGKFGVMGATDRLKTLNEQLAKTKGLLASREATQAEAGLSKGMAVLPTVTVTGARDPVATGSAGNSDRVANALQRLEEQRKAIEAAGNFLDTSTITSQTELFRAADQMERIGATTASLLKGLDPSSDTAQRIRAAATQLEQARTNYTALREAINGAYATEMKYGDGQIAHTETMRQLNQQLATGKLSQAAYTEAVKQANLALLDQQLAAIGAKGGVDGLIAGWGYAAQQYAKQNTAFQQGQQLFNTAKDTTKGFMSDLNRGLREGADVWTTFGNAALNALGKISDKLMEMAIDDLFGKAFGGGGSGGGLFSGAGGWLSGLFGGDMSAGASDVGTNLTSFAGVVNAKGNVFDSGNVVPFAHGGVVSSPTFFPMANGGTGLMGEAGQEGIFPLTRGPDGRLGVSMYGGGRGSSGGGMTSVTVQQTVMVGSVVSEAQHQQDLQAVREEARKGVSAAMVEAYRTNPTVRKLMNS
jgi:hypothetical protein